MYYFKIKTKIKNKGPDKMSRNEMVKKRQSEIISRMEKVQKRQRKTSMVLEKMLSTAKEAVR